MSTFLRDFACSVCGSVREDVLADARELTPPLECERCGAVTEHVAVCNGGMGSRFRFADFPDDPRFYRGQVEVLPPSAMADGKTVCGLDGKPMASKFSDPEKRAERRERQYWETDHKRGLTTQTFDQGKN